ncbi:hypothetical protein AB0L40_12440 [Patulibacter sp. NPDC049589]|uniref:hypothetical protein n=1 Tax=Patulibacter sp. NPDC049589 TaxID=3154731 RepID=UPI00342698EA
MLIDDDRIAQVIVTDRDAETGAGVGIGDGLEVARRAYDHLACDGAITGSDATNPQYPYYGGHLAGRSGITSYGDPIESITLDDGVTGPRLTRR